MNDMTDEEIVTENFAGRTSDQLRVIKSGINLLRSSGAMSTEQYERWSGLHREEQKRRIRYLTDIGRQLIRLIYRGDGGVKRMIYVEMKLNDVVKMRSVGVLAYCKAHPDAIAMYVREALEGVTP